METTTVTKTRRTKRISKTKSLELIKANGSKMFTATFVKKNGDNRVVNGMIKTPITNTNLGYVPMYEMKSKEYRNVNLQTLTNLSIGGTKYKIN